MCKDTCLGKIQIVGDILYCTKKTQNKTGIGWWRLLLLWHSKISHLTIIFVWSRKQFESNLSERLGFRPNNQLSLYYYIGSLWPISKLATTFFKLIFRFVVREKKTFFIAFLTLQTFPMRKNLKQKRLYVLSALARTSFIGYVLDHKNI